MSTMAFGAMVLHAESATVSKEVRMAFMMEAASNRLGFGSLWGGNVTPETYRYFEKESLGRRILFELMDTPLDNVAEALFAPDGVSVNGAVPERLDARMAKVQSLFFDMMSNPEVERIVFLVNDIPDEIDLEKEISLDLFTETMVNIYTLEDGFVPCIKLNIVR